MNALALAKALWPAARKHAMRLGRWVIDQLSNLGIKALRGGTRAKIKKLSRRMRRLRKKMSRAKSLRKIERVARKMKWIEDRILRRLRLLAWLDEKESDLTKEVNEKLSALLDSAVPEKSPEEMFNKWRADRAENKSHDGLDSRRKKD